MHWMLSYTVNHTLRAENKPPSAGRTLGLVDEEDEASDVKRLAQHDEHHVQNHDTDTAKFENYTSDE